MKRLARLSLEEFTGQLSSRTPTPGGGCASALTAALGVSLQSMVIVFTLGKPAFSRHEKMLKAVLARSVRLRRRFLELIDADAAAYASKDTRKAMAVPVEVCRLCLEAAADCVSLTGRTNRHLASDLAAAALLLESAFTSARYSVEANCVLSADKEKVKAVRRQTGAWLKQIVRMRAKVEAGVGRTLRR